MNIDQVRNYSKESILDLISNQENPVSLTFISISSNKPISIPIWTYFHEDKFYCFASGSSKKVQSIKTGNNIISLLIINKNFYPHPESGIIPFLGISGKAKICTSSDNPETALIHQKLLLKYDPDLSQGWIRDLYNKIKANPKDDWLIEIYPERYYSG